MWVEIGTVNPKTRDYTQIKGNDQHNKHVQITVIFNQKLKKIQKIKR